MKVFLVSVMAIAMAGCSAAGKHVQESQLSAFKPGDTTKTQVIEMLGNPTMQMKLPDGTTTIVYTYFESRVRPETFIPLVGAFVGGADTRTNTATLRFDTEGKLIDTSSTASSIGSGMGAAAGSIQPKTLDQPKGSQ